MPRNVDLYYVDILKACTYILQATDGMTREAFFAHEHIPFAVERNFMIIGEALAQMRQHYPDIFAKVPHASMIVGFRNILVHAYASADPLAVWSAIQSDVLPLQLSIETLRSAQMP